MKGLILCLDKTNKINSFVNSDFAGGWKPEFSHFQESALSRMGFVITYAGCPVHWASKIQTEVSLSTCEAELIVFNMNLLQLLPMGNLRVVLFVSTGLKQGKAVTRQQSSKPCQP